MASLKKEVIKQEEPCTEEDDGRLEGTVLWYNCDKEFGFIVPLDTNCKVLSVVRSDIQAVSSEDGVQALQTDQNVKYTLDEAELAAREVTDRDGNPIDFRKKIQRTNKTPRFIILPERQNMFGRPPMHHPGMFGPPARPMGPPQLPVSDQRVFGRVTEWVDGEGWGYIKPDGNYKPVVVERDAIQTDGYPALDIGSLVQFTVGAGPLPNTVTAEKISASDGKNINFTRPFLKKTTEITPISDEIHKGVLKYFTVGKHFGFISKEKDGDKMEDEGKSETSSSNSKDDDIFVHASECNWALMKKGDKVEFKIGKTADDRTVAHSVTGPNGKVLKPPTRDFADEWKKSGAPAPQAVPPHGPMLGGRPPHGPMPMMAARGGGPGRRGGGRGKAKARNSFQQPTRKRIRPSFEKKKCELCDKTMVGEEQYAKHLQSKGHIHKAEMQGLETGCDACKVEFSSKSHRDSHMSGKKHLMLTNPLLFNALYPNYESKRQRYRESAFTNRWSQHKNNLVSQGLMNSTAGTSGATIAPPVAY